MQSLGGYMSIRVSHSMETAPVVLTGLPGCLLLSTRRMWFDLKVESAVIKPEKEAPMIATSYMPVWSRMCVLSIYDFELRRAKLGIS